MLKWWVLLSHITLALGFTARPLRSLIIGSTRHGALRFTARPLRSLIIGSTRHGALRMLVDSKVALDAFVNAVPPADKARVVFKLKGTALSTALFRAELKKELTMFRGCPARFELYSSQKEAAIIAEGKVTNLKRFGDDWLRTYTLPASERKASFQGPVMQVQVTSAKWETFKQELKGFLATVEAPMLDSSSPQEGQKEASAMAGTDESV